MVELAPGLPIGPRYRLVRRLGAGGEGETWVAESGGDGARVALRLLPPGSADDAALRARWRECERRADELGREHAVPVLALDTWGDRLFVVTEYQPGGDIGHWRGRPYVDFAQPLAAAARALAALHAAGLVHRQFKASNVLLDDAGRARLADLVDAVADGAGHYHVSPQQLKAEPATPADDLYAFGALLYELLAGVPPFHPSITREQVLYEPPPPLVPRHPAPERARMLALKLLAKSPDLRPASASEVADELLRALAEPPEESVAPVTVARAAPVAAVTPSTSSWGRWLAIGGAVAALAAVVLVLPTRVGDRNAEVAEQVAAEVAASRAARESAAKSAATIEEQQKAAATARVEFERRQQALLAKDVASWGGETYAKAKQAGETAAERLAAQEPAAATAAWQQGIATLTELEQRLPAALAAALDRGRDALAAGRSGDARAAFDQALLIEPANARALAGRKRAESLDAVLSLVDGAAQDEAAGRLAQAESRYREALAIDAEAPGAREALARLASGRAGDAYATAMSQGLAAQVNGNRDGARAAFLRAAALRPDAREPRDALAALDQGSRSEALGALQQQAQQAESEERWADAAALYARALELEPTLAFARAGRDRAAPRAELARRLDALLAKPATLWSPQGRDEAKRTLTAARAAAPRGPELDAATTRLAAMLEAAEKPVRVAVESDAATDVVIYRVGRLGAFDRREVQLMPGRYTIVGTRAGFRDVRRELVIEPGAVPAPVVVRCEERI